MGRKSKLSATQWETIAKRMLDGDSTRSLAREFGVSESTIREKLSAQQKKIKTVANQIVTAHESLNALPITAQISAQNLAARMLAVSENLAGSAAISSATAMHFAGLAHEEAMRVKTLNIEDADAAKAEERMRRAQMAQTAANTAATIGTNLLKISKDVPIADEEPTPVQVVFGVKDASRHANDQDGAERPAG